MMHCRALLLAALLAGAISTALAHDGGKTHNGVDQKIAELTEILKQNPNDENALADRGYFYLMFQDEIESGLADFAKLVELKPKYEAGHVCLGLARFRMGDLKGALAELEPLCAADTKNPAAWATRAQIRHELHDEKGALADFDHALEVTPKKWPLALAQRAEVKAALGDDAGALADFAKALEIDPRHIDTLRARARFNGERDRKKESDEDLDAATQYSRTKGLPDGRTHAIRAALWRRHEWVIDAEAEAKLAVELFRKDAELSRSNAYKASVLLEAAHAIEDARRRPLEALDVLDEALALMPDRPDLLAYRVHLLEAAGDAEKVVEARKRYADAAATKLPPGVDLAAVQSGSR